MARVAFVPRLLAFLIDGIMVGIISFFLWPLWWILGVGGGIIGWWFWAIILAVYMLVMEGQSGQTLGKMIMKVKVVREDMTPITMQQEQSRVLAILLYPLLIPIILDLMWISEEGQSLGDKWAHTVVIQVP